MESPIVLKGREKEILFECISRAVASGSDRKNTMEVDRKLLGAKYWV